MCTSKAIRTPKDFEFHGAGFMKCAWFLPSKCKCWRYFALAKSGFKIDLVKVSMLNHTKVYYEIWYLIWYQQNTFNMDQACVLATHVRPPALHALAWLVSLCLVLTVRSDGHHFWYHLHTLFLFIILDSYRFDCL